MNILIAVLAVVLTAVVVLVISAPLRTPQSDGDLVSAEQGELEAAREAKYREIRDAELDFRTGKLSREDYEATDSALRAEALEILNRVEGSAGARAGAQAGGAQRADHGGADAQSADAQSGDARSAGDVRRSADARRNDGTPEG